jgi:hypothetical protein
MKKMFKKIVEFVKKDKVERALKTFIEAFASYIAVNIMAADLSSMDAIKAILVGAVASALSVLINSFKKEIKDELEDW